MKKRTVKCKICDAEYQTYNEKTIACSRQCFSKWKSINYKGRVFSDEHNRKLSISKLKENVLKSGEFPCGVCNKVFYTNTSLRSHKSYCSSSKEATMVTCSVCNKVFKRQRGLTWHMKLHDSAFFQMHSQKIIVGIADRKPMKRNSQAEICFMSKLCQIYGNEVVHKFRIPCINHEYDFFIPSKNLIIEFDGDYWHGNKEHFVLTPRMKKQYNIDLKYTIDAIKMGYHVHRIWDSDSSNYPEKLRMIISV